MLVGNGPQSKSEPKRERIKKFFDQALVDGGVLSNIY